MDSRLLKAAVLTRIRKKIRWWSENCSDWVQVHFGGAHHHGVLEGFNREKPQRYRAEMREAN